MFTELGKVLTHPRCVNCHPAGDRPHQGELGRLHQPPVERGADGHGLAAMRCSICHQKANFDPGRVPGHPEWHLAPREMAWEGKTLAEICAQIKDPARNGGRKPEDLVHHIGNDTLVGWAWAPGFGRQARSRHAKASGRAGRGLGEDRSGLSRQMICGQPRSVARVLSTKDWLRAAGIKDSLRCTESRPQHADGMSQ